MKVYLKILLSFSMLLNFWNLSAQATVQLSNQTPTKITHLFSLTEAEMSTPLDFAQLQSRNVLKTPLAPGSTRSVPLKWADAGPRHLLAIAESAPGSFENTLDYFMIYQIKESKLSLNEQHWVYSAQPGLMSEMEPGQLVIENKSAMPIYHLSYTGVRGMNNKS